MPSLTARFDGKWWASRGRTVGRMGSSGMKRRGRAHLPKVRGTPAGPRPWFGGGAYGMPPWGLGRPAPSSMHSVDDRVVGHRVRPSCAGHCGARLDVTTEPGRRRRLDYGDVILQHPVAGIVIILVAFAPWLMGWRIFAAINRSGRGRCMSPPVTSCTPPGLLGSRHASCTGQLPKRSRSRSRMRFRQFSSAGRAGTGEPLPSG